jgi:hypothetical protein
MSFPLPYNAYKWCNKEELEYLNKHLLEIPNDNLIGYQIECDITYPKELHDSHNDYLFFPEHKVITDKYLSLYWKRLTSKNRFEGQFRRPKSWLQTWKPTLNIFVDYRTLKLAIQNGLILKKIHCAIKFEQRLVKTTY